MEEAVRFSRDGGEARRVQEAYGGLLTTVVRSVLAGAGSAEDTEECVQDVLWEYLRSPEKWDEGRGSEKTYLCVLARSRARSLRRRLAARAELPLEEELALTAPDGTETAILRDALTRVLAALTEEERRLFTLRFLYQFATADIAVTLGLSPTAVTTRTARLRKKLKKLLAREGVGVDDGSGGVEDET